MTDFSNIEKVFWPKERYTKGDVLRYYDKVAPYLLPHLRGRPESLNRHPDGIKGEHFYQKDVSREKLPKFIKTRALKAENGKRVRYALIDNKQSLLWCANFGCIEINPWQSRVGALQRPDYLTIDLDPPARGRNFDDVVVVAQHLHRTLDALKLNNYCKTSGKTGLHIMVPLGAAYSYQEARKFAKALVQKVNADLPKLTTLEQRLAKRRGRIYLDIARNAYGQTTAAPYSLRPYPGATVSTPLEWREVTKGLRPWYFTIKTILPRLKRKGDLLRPMRNGRGDIRRARELLRRAKH